MTHALQGRARFGVFELDPRAGELHHDGQSVILKAEYAKLNKRRDTSHELRALSYRQSAVSNILRLRADPSPAAAGS